MGKPFEIRKEIGLDAGPEQVWAAIATGPGLTAWFMPMEVDPDSPMVTSWEPGRRFAVRIPPAPDGSFQVFDYRIEAAGPGRTVLRFVHSGFTGDDWGDDYDEITGLGWDMYLHTLGQYLTHFAGRPALYLEAEAPPASAKVEAWPRLVAALGLPDPVETGAPVRFDLPGVGPVEAVVDYATPSFIGLRAPLALIRFHGRARMGMPVGVSQHTYVTTFDVASAQRGWESWLAGVFG
ncbi:MAG TPA: SRPBCC domain-containing protein [Acidimicrobiia bacterium]|nr:SRPBCC domain-containing protein [Acidimicrobiia bacterium]HKN91978.1 SRPBCC domain-containing protein [Acidimicrobiia bacterium]